MFTIVATMLATTTMVAAGFLPFSAFVYVLIPMIIGGIVLLFEKR